MKYANVKLSKNELSVVTDAAFILTKNNIIAKVYQLFGLLSDEWQNLVTEKKNCLPAEILTISPKIYKGEQYLGLPYVMLDYPRVYSVQNVLAIRCFFWWGNFFSITLHLQGRFMHANKAGLMAWVDEHAMQDWFICVNADAWQHHFGENNYCSIDILGNDILKEALLNERGFIKLAKKMPVEQWDDAVQFFMKGFAELLQVFSC
jgi:hypothetical protein